MASNYLEQLVSEWYEHQGYFLRRNVRVGPRPEGGHEGELDIVAYRPNPFHVIHIETSMDTDSWKNREPRFAKKFQIGRKYVPSLFQGLPMPANIDQLAVFGIASTHSHSTIGGAPVTTLELLLQQIVAAFPTDSWLKRAVPESLPILRTLQVVSHFRKEITKAFAD